MKTAIITGATGQDGAYMAQLLLEKGYRVVATHRRSSSANFWRLKSLGLFEHPRLSLVDYEVGDVCAAIRLLDMYEPAEIYNLAAQSFVGSSFHQPVVTSLVNGIGSLSLLEAIRTVDRSIRFYQASSAEMFGKVQAIPQNETTPFYPRSPYGVSKVFGHWMAVNYREAYDLFVCSGILFNHESPLRGREFVTRHIAEGVAAIAAGSPDPIRLGSLNSCRDWGYARDFVRGMWLMLQAQSPDDFVLATGRTESVRRFATMAFEAIGREVEWVGSGEDEIAVDKANGQIVVRVDPALYRPAEVDLLMGDSRKACDRLDWRADTTLEQLCAMMVDAEVARRRGGEAPADRYDIRVVASRRQSCVPASG